MTSGGLGFLGPRIWIEFQLKRFNHDDIKFYKHIKFEVHVSISGRANRKRPYAPMNFYLDEKNEFGHLLALGIPAPSK